MADAANRRDIVLAARVVARVICVSSALASMDPQKRTALERNERSRHEPCVFTLIRREERQRTQPKLAAVVHPAGKGYAVLHRWTGKMFPHAVRDDSVHCLSKDGIRSANLAPFGGFFCFGVRVQWSKKCSYPKVRFLILQISMKPAPGGITRLSTSPIMECGEDLACGAVKSAPRFWNVQTYPGWID